ncbi:hypothetical protein ACFPN7_48625 [Amycolatopsis halotolerans]|uniref:hypothetical protein n=1 Tax=Amycolatopsis halotolerans TaxID=330083 RepID=UPI003612B73B
MGDGRVSAIEAASREHADASLPQVTEGPYAVAFLGLLRASPAERRRIVSDPWLLIEVLDGETPASTWRRTYFDALLKAAIIDRAVRWSCADARTRRRLRDRLQDRGHP